MGDKTTFFSDSTGRILTPEQETEMWRKECGRVNLLLQDERTARVYYEDKYKAIRDAVRILIEAARA